jgi:1,4-alpha-glucan branching enzyme
MIQHSTIGPQDLYLFNEGTHRRLWEKLGAHPMQLGGQFGTHFAVWAPNAESVQVVGDFNHWSDGTQLQPVQSSGVWAGFVPGLGRGALYKYRIQPRGWTHQLEKADPFGFMHETPPRTASVVWDLDYEWNDHEWMQKRAGKNALNAPLSTYEVHLGSWMRVPEEGGRSLSYRELAERLIPYVKALGFTHIEFMPVMEHPFFGSWGYQVTGYFAASSRYGTPQDLMALIDACHQNDLGVILDWVPSHFPTDAHGLAQFDGTHLYEHADPRQGFHPDWQSAVFNYGRNEVRSFLTSSALFWLKEFHADGLRVDGVASMLYLDYSRREGEWIPNRYGGRENIEAIELLRQVNRACYAECPDVQMIAEESTAWGGVSHPTDVGGLGFGMKWDMGWMHDTLQHFERDPIHRAYHMNELTFRAVYALNENFVLPLSHDEVVYGKGSMICKMPGDDWQKFANLRLLYSYMWTLPGKKLLFMGGEFAQWSEWVHDSSLDWHLASHDRHRQIQELVSELNQLYRAAPALHELEFEASGFSWIRMHDTHNCVMAYLRRGSKTEDCLLIALNLTPVVRENFRLGVPFEGAWSEVFNSDASKFGGTGQFTHASLSTGSMPYDDQPYSLELNMPPLGAVVIKPGR